MPLSRFVLAASLIPVLAVCNLVVSGQPWGDVYGLGLWGAKIAQAVGADPAASAYWSFAGNAERLRESVLLDITSLTNFGLIAGAFVAMRWRAEVAPQTPGLRSTGWIVVLLAGLALGYGSCLAFGCNVGAFFSGIATGSLRGWVWFLSAFLGAALGIRLRERLVVRARQPSVAGNPA